MYISQTTLLDDFFSGENLEHIGIKYKKSNIINVLFKNKTTKQPTIKSPLRYPGGKSKALNFILPYLQNYKEIYSPFLGGGSIELNLSSIGIKIYGGDTYPQLINFWQQILTNRMGVYNLVYDYWNYFHNKNIEREDKRTRYYEFREFCKEHKNGVEEAAKFFCVNRISYSALTLLGGFSFYSISMEFGKGILERLKNFESKNLSVELLDFQDGFKKYRDLPVYADPPYLIPDSLYGENKEVHSNFDHIALFNILKDRKNWVLSYNDCTEIREMYKDFEIIPLTWKYGMHTQQSKKENGELEKGKAKQGGELLILGGE